MRLGVMMPAMMPISTMNRQYCCLIMSLIRRCFCVLWRKMERVIRMIVRTRMIVWRRGTFLTLTSLIHPMKIPLPLPNHRHHFHLHCSRQLPPPLPNQHHPHRRHCPHRSHRIVPASPSTSMNQTSSKLSPPVASPSSTARPDAGNPPVSPSCFSVLLLRNPPPSLRR